MKPTKVVRKFRPGFHPPTRAGVAAGRGLSLLEIYTCRILVDKLDVEGPQVGMQPGVPDRDQVRSPDSFWCECHSPGGVTNAEPDFQSARFHRRCYRDRPTGPTIV